MDTSQLELGLSFGGRIRYKNTKSYKLAHEGIPDRAPRSVRCVEVLEGFPGARVQPSVCTDADLRRPGQSSQERPVALLSPKGTTIVGGENAHAQRS